MTMLHAGSASPLRGFVSSMLPVMLDRRDIENSLSAVSILLIDRRRQLLARTAAGLADQTLQAMIRLEAGRLMGLGSMREETLATLCETCLNHPEGYAAYLLPFAGHLVQFAVSFRRLTTHDGLNRDEWLMICIQPTGPAPDIHLSERLKGYRLTRTQSRILEALLRGLDPQAIASSHHISLPTVRTHLQHLRKKFGCRKTSELILHVMTLSAFAADGARDLAARQQKNHQ